MIRALALLSASLCAWFSYLLIRSGLPGLRERDGDSIGLLIQGLLLAIGTIMMARVGLGL